MASKIREKRLRAMKTYYHTPKGRFSHYKSRAKEKGLEFSLENLDFSNLLASPCHYCGIPRAYGVDRIDSSKGYFLGNVLPCCKICNLMKRDYTYKEFMNHIRKIFRNKLA